MTPLLVSIAAAMALTGQPPQTPTPAPAPAPTADEQAVEFCEDF